MEKLYCDEILEGANDCTKELSLNLYNFEKENKELLTEEEFKSWLIKFHNHIREKLNFPNKLFSLLKIEDKDEVNVVMFPKEPDDNYYKVYFDREVMKPYILVEDGL